MVDQMVSHVPDGVDGHLAVPTGGTGAGVLVLHAWWGLNPFLRGLCDRLASEGFVALAPDLYHGKTAATVEEAKRLRSRLRRETVSSEIVWAAEALAAHPAVLRPDLGLIGFSLGAYWALWLADQPSSPIRATVLFYGARGGDYATTRSTFLFNLAETDEWVSASSVKSLERALRKAGKEATFHIYPGAGHWFLESDRPEAYNALAAELAWARTVKFLHQRLLAA
jgi:carboxymethylenebutenolidase